jgi:hypothetical protein
MKLLHCPRCKNQVYYENTSCEKCSTEFGFSPQKMDMVEINNEEGHVACLNRAPTPVCNWVVNADAHGGLCSSCELTSTIPPLDCQQNLQRWVKAETAKRRLLYTLLSLGLRLVPLQDSNAARSLALKPDGGAINRHLSLEATLEPKQKYADGGGVDFRWLVPQAGVPVMTGHDQGVITLNMLEVDDGLREVQRERFNEYMRTVLGHLRHEVAHHLFERLIKNTSRLTAFRQLFGDETQDYATALANHYAGVQNGEWQTTFVSAYAASHPLEDWAETTAHYLLMVDALETATSWGLSLANQHVPVADSADGKHSAGVSSSFSNEVVDRWLPIARFLNAMSRSLGQRDSYSYLITDAVLRKLQFVDETLRSIAPMGPDDAKVFAKESARMADA